MNNHKIKCLCGEDFEEKKYKKHFIKCNPFIAKFEKFDYKLSILLEEFLQDKGNYIYIRFLLKRYLKIIDKNIKNIEKEINIKQDIRNKIQKDKYENSSTINGITPVEETLNGNKTTTNETINENETPGKETYNETPGNENYNEDNQNNKNDYKEKSYDKSNIQKESWITPNINLEKVYNNKNYINYDNNTNNNNENNKNNNLFDYVLDFGKNYLSAFFNTNKDEFDAQTLNLGKSILNKN